MTGSSALYEGTIRHRRHAGAAGGPSAFRHRVALAYIDLGELPELLDGRLVRRRPGLARFRRADYLKGTAGRRSLTEAVRDRAQALTGERPEGPIRVLTGLRTFGVCFNPISLYYCFAADGAELRCVVAEVTNTPWGERHAYALADHPADAAGTEHRSRVISGRFAKALHVSPFFGMDHTYRARASLPGETVSVHIENEQEGRVVFDATLGLRRRPLTAPGMRRQLVRYPAASARVLALIYGHALLLRLRGARFFPHPAAAT